MFEGTQYVCGSNAGHLLRVGTYHLGSSCSSWLRQFIRFFIVFDDLGSSEEY